MITVLAVREIIMAQIRTTYHDFIIEAVKLHMLQAPSFVDAAGNETRFQTCEIGRVEHADLDAGRPKFAN